MAAAIMGVSDALREAGASDEKARAAAQAIATRETRFYKIESDMLILKWMVSAAVAGILSLMAKAFGFRGCPTCS